MVAWFKSLFRHFQIRHLGVIALANVFSTAVFAATLLIPQAVKLSGWDDLIVIVGFLLTGQIVALTARLLDVRFRGDKPEKGGVLRAWKGGWVNGLVLGAVLVAFFSLVFLSVPYYWKQGSAFGWFSIAVLSVGALLLLGGLPFFLPVRHREQLGLLAAIARSFRIMNANPALALSCALFSLLSILASLGTLGLFPGWAGLTALHQGVYDHSAKKSEEDSPEGP